MQKLNLTVLVESIGQTSILVPDDMTIKQAIEYAKENLSSIDLPISVAPIGSVKDIDEDNSDFDDENALTYCTLIPDNKTHCIS